MTPFIVARYHHGPDSSVGYSVGRFRILATNYSWRELRGEILRRKLLLGVPPPGWSPMNVRCEIQTRKTIGPWVSVVCPIGLERGVLVQLGPGHRAFDFHTGRLLLRHAGGCAVTKARSHRRRGYNVDAPAASMRPTCPS